MSQIVLVIGHIGSDAGYRWIDASGHVHVVPGWNPEAYSEVAGAIGILKEAVRLKSPAAEKVIQGALEILQKELPSEHTKAGGANTVIVIG
jgi:hypothetical protein